MEQRRTDERVRAGYEPVIAEARRLLARRTPVVIAIDGRCASGKTGLAALLEAEFACRVFHMDDFYLPFSQRPAGWEQIPAGNIDMERFRDEVLIPASLGQAVEYRAYSCAKREMAPPRHMPPSPLSVVEGSYSQYPELVDRYALRVFLTCPPEVQRRRLEKRQNGEVEPFLTRWIPMEEWYYRAFGLPDAGAMVIDTAGLFKP